MLAFPKYAIKRNMFYMFDLEDGTANCHGQLNNEGNDSFIKTN